MSAVNYLNKSGGRLILPDGREVENGQTIGIEPSDNVAVAAWIQYGLLVPVAVNNAAQEKPVAETEQAKRGPGRPPKSVEPETEQE